MVGGSLLGLWGLGLEVNPGKLLLCSSFWFRILNKTLFITISGSFLHKQWPLWCLLAHKLMATVGQGRGGGAHRAGKVKGGGLGGLGGWAWVALGYSFVLRIENNR